MVSTSVGGRAVVAVGLLSGFYVLALAVLAALVAGNALVLAYTGRLYWAPVAFSLLTALAVVRGVVSILGREQEDAEGVTVSRDEEPRLWSLVDDVARAMGTRGPDDLRIVHDVNAWVSEQGGWLGMRRGRRRLAIGLGLVQVLDADQLRAVIAHELGHYARGDTLLGPLNYRAAASVQRTAEHLGSGTVLGAVFAAYARLFLRVSLAVRRRQELGADAAAARIGGSRAHAAALRAVSTAGPAYSFFLQRYVVPLWSRGAAPLDLYSGFRSMWGDARRRHELAALAEASEAAGLHPLDSHPPLAERLAAIEALADPGERRDQVTARSLLADPDSLERRVTRELGERATGGPVAPLTWDDAAGEMFRHGCVDVARHVLAAVARVDGGPTPADGTRLLAALSTEAVVELAFELAGDVPGASDLERAREQATVLVDGVATALGAALVETGVARWRMSWSWPLELAAGDRPLEVRSWVEEAVDRPGGPALLGERLRALGWDPAWVPPPAAPEPDAGQDLLGVLCNLRSGRVPVDGLVLTDELVLARSRSSIWERVSTAVATSVGMSRGDHTTDRVRRLFERTLDELLADDPGNRRIPWSSVRSARLRRRLLAWRLELQLAAGEVVTLDPRAGAPARKAVAQTLRSVLGGRVAA